MRSTASGAESERLAVTGLRKLIRTTAFKLMAAYLLVFTLFAASLLGYFFWNAQRLLGSQISNSINAEINSLSDEYAQGGVMLLASTIEARTRRPGSLLYLLTTPQGEALVGNVSELPDGVTGWLTPLKGEGVADGVAWRAGECVTVSGSAHVSAAAGSDVLFAYPGTERI